jgi:hypothetical protein
MPLSPDIICCIDGAFVGLEVKRPKGDLSDPKKELQQNIEKAGGRYYVVRSIDDVQEFGL